MRERERERGREEVRLKRRKNPKTVVGEFWLPPEEHHNDMQDNSCNNITQFKIIRE